MSLFDSDGHPISVRMIVKKDIEFCIAVIKSNAQSVAQFLEEEHKRKFPNGRTLEVKPIDHATSSVRHIISHIELLEKHIKKQEDEKK